MALRVGRGLFRLWLVLSVLWIGGVGGVTWHTLPSANDQAVTDQAQVIMENETMGGLPARPRGRST
jgi:hypothetical protein